MLYIVIACSKIWHNQWLLYTEGWSEWTGVNYYFLQPSIFFFLFFQLWKVIFRDLKSPNPHLIDFAFFLFSCVDREIKSRTKELFFHLNHKTWHFSSAFYTQIANISFNFHFFQHRQQQGTREKESDVNKNFKMQYENTNTAIHFLSCPHHFSNCGRGRQHSSLNDLSQASLVQFFSFFFIFFILSEKKKINKQATTTAYSRICDELKLMLKNEFTDVF